MTPEEYIAMVEEENKKLRELKCVPSNLKTLIRIDKENERLEEENKKLKELKCIPTNLKTVIRIDEENEELKAEIKKLKEELEWYKKHYEHEMDKKVLKGFGCDFANEE